MRFRQLKTLFLRVQLELKIFFSCSSFVHNFLTNIFGHPNRSACDWLTKQGQVYHTTKFACLADCVWCGRDRLCFHKFSSKSIRGSLVSFFFNLLEKLLRKILAFYNQLRAKNKTNKAFQFFGCLNQLIGAFLMGWFIYGNNLQIKQCFKQNMNTFDV